MGNSALGVDLHGHRFLQDVDRDDEAVLALLSHQDSGQPGERASDHPNPPALGQIWIRITGKLREAYVAHGFDLLIRDRGRDTMEVDHANHPVGAHDVPLACQRRPGKDIPGKEGKLHQLAAILPAGQDLTDGKKGFDLAPRQLSGNRLLVPRPRIQRVPPQ